MKKVIIGALALGATAMLFTGCNDKDNKNTEIQVPKYSVVFDEDANPNTPNYLVEYEEGETSISPAFIPDVQSEVDGFAGVWEDFSLNNENITVTARFGDGSEENPYLIKTLEQFKHMLKDYSKSDTNFDDVKHFKLIENIDLSDVTEDLSVQNFKGVIDGNGYMINDFSGNHFKANNGAMISGAYGVTIKNLRINLGVEAASLLRNVFEGENNLINVKAYNDFNTDYTYYSPDDNNEGPFVRHVRGSAVVNFDGCENHANIVSSAKYMGIFVGGYATPETHVIFKNCEQNSDIISSGSVGILFGNNANIGEYSVENCVVYGKIKSYTDSHVLSAKANSSDNIGTDELNKYDESSEDEIKVLAQFSKLDCKYSASVESEKVTISSGTEANLQAGNYELTLSAYATAANGASIYTNLTFKLPVDGTKSSADFENLVYPMLDSNTYKSRYSKQDADLDAMEWTTHPGYSLIKYAFDSENKCYVFDFSAYEERDLTGSHYTLNAEASNLTKIIVVRDSSGEVIDFVVSFN